MRSDYSLESLKQFIAFVRDKGLASKSTSTGWLVAVNRVLDHLSEGEEHDVRSIDLDAALHRFNNKNPGLLSPKSLGEYRRRVAQVITEFVDWRENPTGYKPRGATPTRRKEPSVPRAATPTRKSLSSRFADGGSPQVASVPTAAHSLSLAFPLRPDFLAQVMVPRDMKAEEARRLGAFLLTLASDYSPAS